MIGPGWVTVRRTVGGNSDLRGFYKIWRVNLVEPTLPVRLHWAVEQDPDPYPPTSYVLFAPLGALPLWGGTVLVCPEPGLHLGRLATDAEL